MPCGRSLQETIGSAVQGNLALPGTVRQGICIAMRPIAVMVALVLRSDGFGSEMLRFAQQALAPRFVFST